MRLIPSLELDTLREGYRLRAQAPFDALGAKLGLDVRVLQMTRALRIVAEPDLWTMLPVLLQTLYRAIASEHAYGFQHVAQPGCRIYTCLAVRDGERVIASVQPSAKGNALPNPGWSLPRWDADEPARNAKALLAWARDPVRAKDAGAFPILAPLRQTNELAHDDVRFAIGSLRRQIDALSIRDPRRVALQKRADDLVDAHRGLLVGELARIVDRSATGGGFVDGLALRVEDETFDGIAVRASRLATALDVFAREAPRRVRILVDRERSWNEIVASGVLARVRDLEITGWHPRPTTKRLELDITRLANVRLDATERLAFSWLGSTDDAWSRLLPALQAPALHALRIDHADIGAEGLRHLASTDHFSGLTELVLGDPRGDTRELVRAVGMRPGLRALAFASLPSRSEDAIAQILEHAELSSFSIDDQYVTDDILAPLALALSKREFDRVALDGHAITPVGIERLLRSPGFANLRHFELRVWWDLSPLFDAMLATNGRTQFSVRDMRAVPAAVRDHIDFVRTRLDGTIVRDE